MFQVYNFSHNNYNSRNSLLCGWKWAGVCIYQMRIMDLFTALNIHNIANFYDDIIHRIYNISLDLNGFNVLYFFLHRTNGFRPLLDNNAPRATPPIFLPTHLASLGSQFHPPLFPHLKGKLIHVWYLCCRKSFLILFSLYEKSTRPNT